MYILYNSNKYPCKCKPSKTMVYKGLPNDFPFPVSGEIRLYDDDDFLMRTDVVEDYLRQGFEGGVLMLTNEPEPVEPEPIPEPVEPEPTADELIDIMLVVTSDE